MFWDIDIKDGIVSFDDISFISDGDELIEYVEYLKEDMLQIEFSNEILLDVSWRPSFDIEGKFFILLIKECDWDNPLEHMTANTISEVKMCIRETICKYVN